MKGRAARQHSSCSVRVAAKRLETDPVSPRDQIWRPPFAAGDQVGMRCLCLCYGIARTQSHIKVEYSNIPRTCTETFRIRGNSLFASRVYHMSYVTVHPLRKPAARSRPAGAFMYQQKVAFQPLTLYTISQRYMHTRHQPIIYTTGTRQSIENEHLVDSRDAAG